MTTNCYWPIQLIIAEYVNISLQIQMQKIIVAYITNRLQIFNHNYTTACLYVNHIGFSETSNFSHRLNTFKDEWKFHRITGIGWVRK